MKASNSRSGYRGRAMEALGAAVILRAIHDVECTSGAVTEREKGDARDWFFDPDRRKLGFEFWASAYGADAPGLRAKLRERWAA